MKRITLSAVAIALIAGSLGTPAQAQNTNQGTAVPHKVGLIDMGYLFKNYKKFKALSEDLQADVQRSNVQAKSLAEAIKAKQGQLAQLEEGTQQYAALEGEIAKAVSEFDAYRKVTQRDFIRKESQIYKTVYLEVTDAVEKYAEYYKYTVVLRFVRDTLESDANKPEEIISRMNRQVIYHRPEDDITKAVLDFLNRRYAPSANGTAPTGN